MIYVVEIPHQKHASVWTAFDEEDFNRILNHYAGDKLFEQDNGTWNDEGGSNYATIEDAMFHDLHSYEILRTPSEIHDFLNSYRDHQWVEATTKLELAITA